MSQVAFGCSSLGFPCEWATRGSTPQEIVERVREHARCAHKMTDLSPDVIQRVESAIRPA